MKEETVPQIEDILKAALRGEDQSAEFQAWGAEMMKCTCIVDWDGNLHPKSACKVHPRA